MRKIAGYILILAAGLFFGFLLGRSALGPAAFEDSVNCQSMPTGRQASDLNCARVASLMLDYGDGTVKVYPDIPVSEGEDLLTLLKKQTTIEGLALETKDYGDLGLLVIKIGDKENGDNGKYWQYWVNNVSVSYAADKYIVKPGDVVEWKFLNYKN